MSWSLVALALLALILFVTFRKKNSSVFVASRNPNRNVLPGVSYCKADLSDSSSIRALIFDVRPTTIIHAACPPATTASAATYERVIVQGTRDLLSIAADAPSVKAFIFTSSATMAAGPEHINLDENAPLADTCRGSHPYARTKAQADKMVLQANNPPQKKDDPGLLTACIRLPIVYGKRDLLSIPGSLTALEKGQIGFQLGDGSNMWDFSSADNAATAHVLLAQALLARLDNPAAPKVDGEAFNITDGERHPFWDFPRKIWSAAGWKPQSKDRVRQLPTRFALAIAIVLEWLFKVFTLGSRRPGLLGRQQVEYSCYSHTYCIDKARKQLGYAPVPGFDEGIRQAVQWSLDHDGWAAKLKNTKVEIQKMQ